MSSSTPGARVLAALAKASSIQARFAAWRASNSARRWLLCAAVSAAPNQGARSFWLPTTWTLAMTTPARSRRTFST